jgi:hypothetical protein
MANTIYNLVRAYTATVGTGPIALGAAVPGYLSFQSKCTDGDVVTYCINDGPYSECGAGTYSAGVLARTTIYDSTNGGSPISLTGNAQVAITAVAQDFPVFPRGQITLDANVASTTRTISGLYLTSGFKWWPATQNAAAINPFVFRPLAGRIAGSITLDHPSNPNTDLTFDYEVSP